jgi:heterodisulfide reductase subunit C2
MTGPRPDTYHGTPPLAATVRRITGVEPARCYQCGKCSAGCPMAGETALRPHDIMRMVNLDRADRLLGDPAIWLCLTCEACTERCPNQCDPARVMDALREMAMARDPGGVPRPIRAFHVAFLDQVHATGRMFELGLVVRYKLKTGALLQDAATTPGLLARGKLKLRPPRIAGVKDVRRIFAACRTGDQEEPR